MHTIQNTIHILIQNTNLKYNSNTNSKYKFKTNSNALALTYSALQKGKKHEGFQWIQFRIQIQIQFRRRIQYILEILPSLENQKATVEPP